MPVAGTSPRIACLVPSLTELLFTLGLERRQHRLELGLSEDLDPLGTAETFGTKLHLRG